MYGAADEELFVKCVEVYLHFMPKLLKKPKVNVVSLVVLQVGMKEDATEQKEMWKEMETDEMIGAKPSGKISKWSRVVQVT